MENNSFNIQEYNRYIKKHYSYANEKGKLLMGVWIGAIITILSVTILILHFTGVLQELPDLSGQ